MEGKVCVFCGESPKSQRWFPVGNAWVCEGCEIAHAEEAAIAKEEGGGNDGRIQGQDDKP